MTRCPPGLATKAAQRAAATKALVAAAIALLKERGEPVTLRRIGAAAAEVPGGHRLAESVIQRNPEADQLYRDACTTRRFKRRRPRRADPRLERMPKAALIDMIHGQRREIQQLRRIIERNAFPDDEPDPPARL